MAGYSGTPLIKKLGIKDGMSVLALNSPVPYEKLLGGLPESAVLKKQLRGKLDFIHLFARSQSELKKLFPKMKSSIVENGAIWISWPKRTSGVETDVTETLVREIGLKAGLVDVKVCAVDETWSGLKFVFRLKDRGRKTAS